MGRELWGEGIHTSLINVCVLTRHDLPFEFIREYAAFE